MAASNPTNAVKATGNAPIVKQGHTTNGQHGSDVTKKPLGRQATRDLNIK